MEPVHYLRALRRRWWVIAASVVVASVAAWVTTVALGSPKVAVARQTTYNATTTLWNTGAPTIGQPVPLPDPATLANLVTLPDVASIAAQAMDTQGNPAALGSQVYATADPVTGLLDITGTAANPEQAVAVSTAYSHALITYLERLKQKKITLQQQQVQRQIQNLQRQGSSAALIASLRSTLSQLALDRTTPIPLAIFQPATAVRDAAPNAVPASSGIQVPKSLPLRIALAALLGLLAGVILALVLERFDTRIRSPTSGGGSLRLAGAGRGARHLPWASGNDRDGVPPVFPRGGRVPTGRRRNRAMELQRERERSRSRREDLPRHQSGGA